jgi:hypothetical protein
MEPSNYFFDRISKPTFYQFGAYQLRIELLQPLFLDSENNQPNLKDEYKDFTLSALANSYAMCGQPRRALVLLETMNTMSVNTGDKENLASGLANIADDQLSIVH